MSEAELASTSEDWLPERPCAIGEILIRRATDGGFVLCHRDDAFRDDLARHEGPDVAAEISRYDDVGRFRPLKTAPSLRHGWRMVLVDRVKLREALDLFYPGRIAAFLAWRRGDLGTTAFRETLERQSGMYRVAAKISDERANDLIGNFCRSDGGCLRTILWCRDRAGTVPSTALPASKFDPAYDQTGRGERGVPLFCQEICSLLVGAARESVKTRE